MELERRRIDGAWKGRISGCQLGKPIEVLSMQEGTGAVTEYLRRAEALPLRDYVPHLKGTIVDQFCDSCRDYLVRSEPDDDINYTVLALMMLEKHGASLQTIDVARYWLLKIPFSLTWTAEREAMTTLANQMAETFAQGAEPGFDLRQCSDNPYSDWIGAQIRADMYGWVHPGEPKKAAELARRDAELSHRKEGVYGAMFVAACGAAIPSTDSLLEAVEQGAAQIPADSDCARAIAFAVSLVGKPHAVEQLHSQYEELHVVHTVNNLSVVVWALLNHPNDFSAAIGEAVAAGWDTDCNGATVGGLWGLQGKPIPEHWTSRWHGHVATDLAGVGMLHVEELVERTMAVGRVLI